MGQQYGTPHQGLKTQKKVSQNKSLRVAAVAYKATPIEVLLAETMIPPMQECLDLLQAKTRMRLRSGGQSAFIGRR